MSTTADRTAVGNGTWQSDPTHSTVAFRIVYMRELRDAVGIERAERA